MSSKQSADPRDRMGIYKRLSDVRSEQRLQRYTGRYEGERTYEQFLETYFLKRYTSDRSAEKARLAGRRWQNHMRDQGRHHALATPSDVEAWMCSLLEDLSMNTVYNIYWVKLEWFYTWLQRHVDHPHSDHPFLMAAAEYPSAGRVWEEKISRGRGGSDD